MTATLPVTVLVAVRNEELNIAKCLTSLKPAQRVLVVDSHSTDRTVEISTQLGAEVVQFDYRGSYPKKRQWALDALPLGTEWILLLDADEVVPDQLWQEIAEVVSSRDAADAYLITKGFHFLGRRFRFGGFSFGAVLLFRRGKAAFEHLPTGFADSLDMEVHERLIVHGTLGRLRTPLIHEDFKSLEAYLSRHNHYSSWEAHLRHYFSKTGLWGQDTIKARLWGNTQERRRYLKSLAMRLPLEPLLWFLYHFILRLGFLEGRRGFIASRIRANYIADVRAKMFELDLRSKSV